MNIKKGKGYLVKDKDCNLVFLIRIIEITDKCYEYYIETNTFDIDLIDTWITKKEFKKQFKILEEYKSSEKKQKYTHTEIKSEFKKNIDGDSIKDVKREFQDITKDIKETIEDIYKIIIKK